MEVNEDHKAVTITKPESRKRAPQIGIDDFGELIRSDVSQAHNFFYDLVFGPRLVVCTYVCRMENQGTV